MFWQNSRTILQALQDQGLPNPTEPGISDFLNSATEEQFTEWLNRMQAQLAGSQMGTFDGETWIPNQDVLSSGADIGIGSSSQMPDQYSIKAGVCLHHLYYGDHLPWSGTEIDFEIRFCDECLKRQGVERGIADMDLNADPEFERQRLEEGVAGIDLNADPEFERHRLAGGFAGIDLNADLSSFNHGSLNENEGLPAGIPFGGYTGQDSSATDFTREELSQSFAESRSIVKFEDLDSFAHEVLEECPPLPLSLQQPIPGLESDLNDEVFDSSLAEYIETLPPNQPSIFRAEGDYSEDTEQEMSEFEDEEMEDAYDEPRSPEIGVSFSPRHIWPGEDIASEEPGYSADYRFLDDEED